MNNTGLRLSPCGVGETGASCYRSVLLKHSIHLEIQSTVVGWKSTSRHTVKQSGVKTTKLTRCGQQILFNHVQYRHHRFRFGHRLHPDNTLAHYVTTLPHRINMSGQWESGPLSDPLPARVVQRQARRYVVLRLSDRRDTSTRSVGGIAVGYYDGPGKLVRSINHTLAGIMGTHKAKLS